MDSLSYAACISKKRTKSQFGVGIMNEMIKSEKSIETQQNEFKDASITVTKNAVNQLKTVMKADSKEDYLLQKSSWH